MRTTIPGFIRCFSVKRLLTVTGALAFVAAPAFAQSGVDNSTATGVFQMEGDAQRTGTICWLPIVNGGPAIATPVSAGTNSTDGNGCPTVNPAGAAAAWSLITYGGSTNDWSSFVFSGGVFTSKAGSLFTPAFVTDATNSATDNTFLGTASKDTGDITTWAWNPHNVQDKDDIEHAYAAAYHLTNGDTAIYAGMDRFSNAGDSTAGFWFIQDSTFALCVGFHLAATANGGAVANNSCTAAGTFVGKHTDGDLLLVSDFSIGGAVSTINVFVWQSGALVLDLTRSPAPCDPLNGGNNLCGLVDNQFVQGLNKKGAPVLVATTTATGGWPFTEKTIGATSFVTGEFLEIAVDLNKIFGANIPCFSTFFSETRSSTSPTASLSDLTTPVSFPLCSVSGDKTCTAAKIVNGNQVQYNFTGHVNNTGSSTLFTPVVYDTPPASTVANSLSITQPTGPITSGNSALFSGSFVSSSVLGSTDKNRISVATSSNSAGTPLNVVCGTNPPTTDANECADWGSPSCTPTITSGLTLTKACKSCLVGDGALHVSVSENFKVCNTGNTNVTGITLKDCQGGTYSGSPGSQVCSGTEVTIASGQTINAGAACLTFSSSYSPTSTAACTGNDCSLHDEAIASGSAAFVGTVFANNGAAASANCPVCPVQFDCSTNPPVAP